MMAERFAGVNVGNVYLDHRRFNGGNGIGDSDGSVCEGSGIENDAVVIEAHLMQFVDDRAFVITLEIPKIDRRE